MDIPIDWKEDLSKNHATPSIETYTWFFFCFVYSFLEKFIQYILIIFFPLSQILLDSLSFLSNQFHVLPSFKKKKNREKVI